MKDIDLPLLGQMLEHIPADGTRGEWVTILMAIKSEFGDSGFEAARTWSASVKGFDFDNFKSTWKSIKAAGKTSIGSLIHEAKQNGFKFAPMSDEEKSRLALESAERSARREKEAEAEAERIAAQHNSAREVAIDIWHNAIDDGHSEYAVKKGIKPYAAKFSADGKNLIVPVYDEKGALWNTQTIYPNTDKRFQKGGAKSGKMLIYPGQILSDFVLVTTGYATFCTLHEATGYQTVAAFDDGNLPKVIELIKKQRPDINILICTDDDYLQNCRSCKQLTTVETEICQNCGQPHKQKNSGILAARKAALKFKCEWVAPQFPENRDGETDFNDLANMQGGGLQIVAEQINAAIQSAGVPVKPATQAAESRQGDGEKPKARSILPIEDIVQRFMFVDDMTGDNVYDNVTREVVKLKKVQAMLPPKVRWDEVKGHPLWETQAVYSDQIGFDPTEKDPKIVCNRYAGWPTKPDGKASCEKLLTMLQHMCSNEMTEQDSSVYEWVIRWLAYPIQNPGAKMQTALIFHGPQGVGKNKFFEAYRDIYGEYGITITQGAMEDQFNSDWADRKLFVLADEVVAQDGKHHLKNDLKTKVTGDYMRINRKMVEARNERNFMNLCFLSNEINPVVLENRDRRYFVIWTPGPLKQSFYDELVQEIKNGGVEALHHFLKNEVNLEGFGPETKPPLTKAKQDLITVNLSPQETFIHKWVTGEFEQIPFGPVQCEKLFDFYIRWADRVKERYAGSDKHFYSSLKRTGWKKTTRKRVNIGGDITVIRMKNFYDPPIELVEKALKAGHTIIEKTEGLGELDYRTKCYTSFIEGIKDYAEESA